MNWASDYTESVDNGTQSQTGHLVVQQLLFPRNHLNCCSRHPKKQQKKNIVQTLQMTHTLSLSNMHSIKRFFTCVLGVGKVCGASQVDHQAGAYLGFCNMERLGVFLLPPGLDVNPSQDYPQQ